MSIINVKSGDHIEKLLLQMTLEEKVSMLSGFNFWNTREIRHLGIPSVKMANGPHGINTMDKNNPDVVLPATCFPTGSAMGATWNPELIYRIGKAIGEEARELGCKILLGPCVNIHRSPLGGRNFESFSEDPHLSAQLTVAYIRGVQSQKIAACVKHFALNNSENQRMTTNSEVNERVMREIYFPSFEKAVREADTWTLMCSYNRINDTYASENRILLTDILKEEWGFQGAVISDWGATHSTVPAAKAGLDLEMPGPGRHFGQHLLESIRSGEVTESIIDDKILRLLSVIEKVNGFETIEVSSAEKEQDDHRQLALEAAQEAIVLLKNENQILPLNKESVRSIAVIGPNAMDARIQGGGSSYVIPHYQISPLKALQEKCGDDMSITYELGCTNNVYTKPLSSNYLVANNSDCSGLRGEYFNNVNFAGNPALRSIDTYFDFTWMPDNPPVPTTQTGDFSIRWSGKFIAFENGTYRFGFVTNGWARIYVDGTLICDNWGESSTADSFNLPETTGEITLEAKESYSFLVEYRPSNLSKSPMRRFRLGCNTPLPHDLIDRAIQAAADCDVAIIFVGLNEEHESEGFDRKDLELPGNQCELIKRVVAANPRTIVILNNGAPTTMINWINDIPAVLECFYPGQECGNAIASVLFGEVNPSGKLPDTFPCRIQDTPTYSSYSEESGRVKYSEGIFVGYRWYDTKNIEPLFPFGHGVSYTSFAYSKLKIQPTQVKDNDEINVSIDIKNTGEVEGMEVVQVYVSDIKATVHRLLRELKAFRKIKLVPGEKKTVNFNLNKEAWSFYDSDKKDWVVEPGDFEVLVGSSSKDIREKKVFTLIS